MIVNYGYHLSSILFMDLVPALVVHLQIQECLRLRICLRCLVHSTTMYYRVEVLPMTCFHSLMVLPYLKQISGEISYNGYKLKEFVPQKTSAFISQDDLHIPEMTVRETLDFSSCCQGTGSRSGMSISLTHS